MKMKRITALSLIILLCISLFSGCSNDTVLFKVCGKDTIKWAQEYDTSAPDELTVYIEHGGLTEEPQKITDVKTINAVYYALSSMRVNGSPDKGPIDFTAAPDKIIYHFRQKSGSVVSFNFWENQLAVGDPAKPDGLLYTCSDTSALFSIAGIDLSCLDDKTGMDDLDSPSPTDEPANNPSKPPQTDSSLEYAVFSSEKQNFSFLYDHAYSAVWDDENGATVYTQTNGSIPYLLVYRNTGSTAGFDTKQSFSKRTAAIKEQYGSRLIDVGALQSYTVSGKQMPGVLYTYTLENCTIEMLALIEITDDSIIQYTCKYVQGNSDATMKALAEAAASYQPDANYYSDAGTSRPKPDDPPQQTPAQSSIKLTKYDGGFFSVMLPEGWRIQTMGQYSTFSFRAWDPDHPDYEIFYYGNINPFIKSEAARKWNEAMSTMTPDGSTYHLYADTPVADGNDVSSIFYNLYAYKGLVEKYTGTYFTPGIYIPTLRNFSVIDQVPIQTALSSVCSNEALIYASLQADSGTNCYGKFSASLYNAPSVMYDGIDMSFIAGLGVSGVVAPQTDFVNVEQVLSQAVFSLTFTQEYIDEANKKGQTELDDLVTSNRVMQSAYDATNAAWDTYIRQ